MNENELKKSLVKQIMDAMNKSGEIDWGDISASDKLRRMKSLMSRLEYKSIEELQELLLTYQGIFTENEQQLSQSMKK